MLFVKRTKTIFTIILIIILSSLLLAKDPMGRGKSQFNPNKAYPQVDISGYEELEFNKMDQSGDSSYYENTSEYSNLPASVKVYDGFRHRLLLDIEGQINEKLYIRYKIMQEPDIPQETDIYVEYDKFSIYFGKYDAALSNGELFSVNKNIDGLHADYIDENYQLEAIYGEERSHKREFSFSGTGKKEYSLGQTNILEGSIKVRINGKDYPESGYSIDYFDGKITFDRIMSATDLISGYFEYVDPIEDFLPISSKVRLSGIQHNYKKYTTPKAIIATANHTYTHQIETQEIKPPLWTELLSQTKFTYEDRNLNIAVQHPELTEVAINYRGNIAKFRKLGNNFEISFPSNKTTKKVSIIYTGAKYSFTKEFELDFTDKVTTKSSMIEKLIENTTDTTSESTTNNIVPEIVGPQIIRTEKITTQSETTILAKPSKGYTISFDEGIININKDRFIEGSDLELEFLPAIPSINSVEIQFKNSYTAMSQIESKYYLKQQLDESFALGINHCYLIIKTADNKTISQKITFFVDKDPNKVDYLKKIILPNTPVVSFSEELMINNYVLTVGKHYKIDYNTGVIKFLTDQIPATANITISYDYQKSTFIQEMFKGKDSKGPYNLSHQNVVPKSLEIKVGNTYLINNIDYTVNYLEGKVYFKKEIEEVEQIVAKYRYYTISNINELNNKKENFTISSYYVQETAKAAESSAEDSITLLGTSSELTITNNQQAYPNGITTGNISISYLPIIDGSLTVYINDVELTKNYTINYYNGEFIITGNTYTEGQIKIDFKKGKAIIAPQETFDGGDININTVDLDLSRPMVYGADNISLEYRDPDTDSFYRPLTYGKDYIVGYETSSGTWDKENGYAVVPDDYQAWERGIITFITANVLDTNTFVAGHNFDTNVQFRLTYRVSGSDSPDPGDIKHKTFGTKINYKPVDNINIDLEYNESIKQFQRAVEYGEYRTVGNNTAGQTIQIIADKEIVEDSELVYINDVLKTRNDDYSINYKTASIRFDSTTILSPTDNIYVEFAYYDTDSNSLEQIETRGTAVKIGTTASFGKTDIELSYVSINSNYDPVGNKASLYTAGTEAKKITITSEPIDKLDIYSNIETLETKQAISFIDDPTKERYRESTRQNYKLDYNFNNSDSIYFAANRTDVSLPKSTSANYSQYSEDTIDYDYTAGATVGPDKFRTTLYLKNAESFTDVLDRENPYQTYNYNRSIKNNFKPWDRLSFTSSLQQNIDNKFTSTRLFNETKSYSELIRFNPWTIDTSFDYSESEYNKEQSESSTEYDNLIRTIGRDKKQVFNFAFRKPAEWTHPIYQDIYLHFDDSYSMTASDLYNQAPDTTRANNFTSTIRPYNFVSIGVDSSYRRSLLDDRNSDEYFRENKINLTNIFPTKYTDLLADDFFIINKLETSDKNTIYKRLSGTTHTATDEKYTYLYQSYTINPLDNLAFDFTSTEKLLKKNYQENSSSGEKVTLTEEPEKAYGFDLDYDLDKLWLIETFKYQWSRDFSQKNTHQKTIENSTTVSYAVNDLRSLSDDINWSYYIGKFSNKHSMDILEEFKKNNSEGVRYSYGKTDYFGTVYKTNIEGLNTNYSLNKIYNLQYTNPDYDTSETSLKSDSYNDKLIRYDDTHRLGVDYTPFAWLTFDTSIYTRKITQLFSYDRVTGSNTISGKGEINSTSYEFGTTYRPFQDFSARYGWRRDVYDAGVGEQAKTTIVWKPATFDLGDFEYNFENTFIYGKGTNDPEQQSSLDNLQGFVQTTVTDRNDVKVRTTLTLNINKDVANVIVDDMLATVNLTRLHFCDRVNPEYSYSVNAFYAKVTLRF